MRPRGNLASYKEVSLLPDCYKDETELPQDETELPPQSTKLKSESDFFKSLYFGGTFVFLVMQGERQSRLFGRTYLHFFVLTLWDYMTQGASHTIRITLMLCICCMAVSRVLPNPQHERLRCHSDMGIPAFWASPYPNR